MADLLSAALMTEERWGGPSLIDTQPEMGAEAILEMDPVAGGERADGRLGRDADGGEARRAVEAQQLRPIARDISEIRQLHRRESGRRGDAVQIDAPPRMAR